MFSIVANRTQGAKKEGAIEGSEREIFEKHNRPSTREHPIRSSSLESMEDPFGSMDLTKQDMDLSFSSDGSSRGSSSSQPSVSTKWPFILW